jgi:hypothetical protein
MKRDLVCPNCEGRQIWKIEKLPEGAGVWHEKGPWGVFSPRGNFELLVCKGCGFTEMYAVGIEGLKHDPAIGVQLLDKGSVGGGPYR